MVLLGLLLIVVAAAAMIEVSVADTTTTVPIDVWDRTFSLSGLELFLAGAVTAVVFLVGLLMVSGGMRRSAVKRRRLREGRLAERERVAKLEAEKRDLERRLADEPTAAPTTAPTSAPVPRAREHEKTTGKTTDSDTTRPTDQLVAGRRPSGDRPA
ncbi:hypothetical protein Pth03_70310 [Planotetraspora thailandica]|uniref:Lipopolysaccharide assembly protein A domain-containing protein n=1 Tax=Planotetraspora thailandica TaxID=487172 RepID=A0A8J3Y0L0_9ACTN|nr:hypothetical protein [Planotetraspora thailandica]GII58642.1 hypothetical protein Pth03_70310 [Planotetraspora thailandica]